MKKFLALLAATFAVSGLAFADSNNNGTSTAAGARALGGVYAPYARVVAIARGNTVYASKGVVSVTHPATGLYCVRPATTFANFNAAVATVTVEWGNSNGTQLLAFWNRTGPNCPAGRFEVRTYNIASGTAVMSDSVAFLMVVP